MGIQNTSDTSVLTGLSASPVQDFLKNPPPTDAPSPDSPPIPPPQPTPSSASTPFTEDDRNQIGTKLTIAIGTAFKTGDLTTEEQLHEVSEDILTIIDQIKTHRELIEVLTALTEKWPFFSSILKAESTQGQAVADIKETFKRRETPPQTINP